MCDCDQEEQFRMNCFCFTPRANLVVLGSVVGFPNLYSIAARTCMAGQSHTSADHFSTLLWHFKEGSIPKLPYNQQIAGLDTSLLH